MKQNKVLSNMLLCLMVFVVMAFSVTASQLPVNLGTAGNYTILAATAITTTGTTSIIGDIGISPAFASDTSGFGLILNSTFSTSSLVTGKVYAADYTEPTPTILTTAISNMETAYTDATGRTPVPTGPFLNPGSSGEIGGLTLSPDFYKWTTDVTIGATNPGNLVLDCQGNTSAVYIFQITGTLDIASSKQITLINGCKASNIFWAVADVVTLGVNSLFNGNILAQTQIALQTGATLNGRALAQTQVTLDANTVTGPQVPTLTTITITPSTTNLSVGNTTQLNTSSLDQYNMPIIVTIFYSTSNASVATVNASGFVTALAAGTTTITALNGSINGTSIITVTVLPVLTTITVSPLSKNLSVGETQQLNATSLDQFDAPFVTTINYTSSNSSVATVNSSGFVTALARGNTTINATSGNVSGTSTITVDTITPILTSIGSKTITQGTLLNFTMTGTSPSGLNVTFTVADKPLTATFVDNNNGTATFSWTPIISDVGLTNVNFTVSDGVKSASEVVAITVNSFDAPTTNATNPGSVWKNADYNVTLNATGFNNTPIAYMNYSLNNVSGQIIGGSGNVLINLSGNNTLKFYAVDTSGNVEVESTVYALLDKESPNITSFNLSATSVNTGESITGTCNVTDNLYTDITGVVTGIDTSSAGTKNATCTATDLAGNSATNSTPYTVNTVPSGGGSGGGGTGTGSSGGSSGSFTLATPKGSISSALQVWYTINAGSTAVMNINNPKIAFTQISINAKNSLTNPSLRVDSLSMNPSKMVATSKVYQYLEFTHTVMTDSDISSVVINFKVPKLWLNENNLQESDIALYRFSNNQWNELTTTSTGAEGYTATSPGFSWYAIGNRLAESTTPAQQIAPKTTTVVSTAQSVPATSRDTSEITSDAGNSITGQSITEVMSTPSWIVRTLILLGLFGLIIGGYFYFRSPNNPWGGINGKKNILPVIDIEGIGSKYNNELNAMGIQNTDQLWEANSKRVARKTGASLTSVKSWQHMSELSSVKDIGPQYAELLDRSGVHSIEQLKKFTPNNLLKLVREKQDSLKLRIQGNFPGHAMVENWINEARNHKFV